MALGANLPVLLPIPNSGVTRYVNIGTGNDAWDGTNPVFQGGSVGPWATYQKGLTSGAGVGNTLIVAAGNYGTSGSTVHTLANFTGNSSQPFYIRAADPANMPVIRGRMRFTNNDYVRVDRMIFEGVPDGNETNPVVDEAGAASGNSHIHMNYCHVRNSGPHNAGLFNSIVGPSLFLNGKVYNNGDAAVDTGHSLHQGAYHNAGIMYFVNSFFYDNCAYGIQTYNQATIDCIVSGCVSVRNHKGFLVNCSTLASCRWYNSIAYDNTDRGFSNEFERPGTFEAHSLISNGNGGTAYNWFGTPANNSNLLTGSPAFVDSDNNNWHIGSTSVGRGLAIPEWAWPTDYDGNPRHPTAPDIGAFEFEVVQVDTFRTVRRDKSAMP